MEDVLEVYQRPPDPDQPLVCMDEASRQLIEEVREPLAGQPGRAPRYDSEYRRNGTANIFMLYEPLSGRRHVRITDRRTAVDWALVIKELADDIHPNARKITLVMDNLNTHAPASLYEAFDPVQARRILSRLEIHYTPKHGSWLNMAEIELSVLQRQCLAQRIATRAALESATSSWQQRRNDSAAAIQWQFTTDDARTKLRYLYPKTIPNTNEAN